MGHITVPVSASGGGGSGQPLDDDLTAIAALDSSTAGALVTDGSGWIRKTYAQLKTALTLVKADVGLGNVDNTSDANKPVSTAQDTAITARGLPLIPTAVKTGAYSAAAQDLVPVDTTSGAVTVTLPTAPADKTQVAVKHVIQGSTNAVTIALGGSDVINKAGGVTTMSLPLLAQAAVLQYKSSSAIWYVVSTDVPLAQTDLRYAGIASAPVAHAASHLQAGSDPYTGGPKLYSSTSDVTNSTTSGTAILVSGSLAAGVWEIDIHGQYSSDTDTAGMIKTGFSFSGTQTSVNFQSTAWTSTTASRSDNAVSIASLIGGGSGGTTGNHYAFTCKGRITVSVAGALTFLTASVTTAKQITTYTGTVMRVTPVLG